MPGAQTGSSANQKSFLTNRANEAKNTGCDLYLAIHSNAATGKTRGTRIYYYTKSAESLRFAKVLQSTFNYPDKSNIKLAYNDALMEIDVYKRQLSHGDYGRHVGILGYDDFRRGAWIT